MFENRGTARVASGQRSVRASQSARSRNGRPPVQIEAAITWKMSDVSPSAPRVLA